MDVHDYLGLRLCCMFEIVGCIILLLYKLAMLFLVAYVYGFLDFNLQVFYFCLEHGYVFIHKI